MPVFKDDKDGVKITDEVKEHTEVLRKLGDEVKMLRKEVDFLTTLAKKNEEDVVKQRKILQGTNDKLSKLFAILELDDKEL
ncbi:MAG: hypothetical protein JW724_03015 [Candidatus Altiarchaeota archaeon]|nr:hypothetical protein [Candidatus Altiarchaeota archaeon]